MSDDSPDTPSNPDSWFSTRSSASTGTPHVRCRYTSSPGSIEPLRVPIMSPSSGVNPIEVSTDLPSLVAVTDAPFPR
jgi:hypothetical protein